MASESSQSAIHPRTAAAAGPLAPYPHALVPASPPKQVPQIGWGPANSAGRRRRRSGMPTIVCSSMSKCELLTNSSRAPSAAPRRSLPTPRNHAAEGAPTVSEHRLRQNAQSPSAGWRGAGRDHGRLGEAQGTDLPLAELKFLATAGTALVSVGAYSLLFGWPLPPALIAHDD